jgi:molecular chaperone DnaK
VFYKISEKLYQQQGGAQGAGFDPSQAAGGAQGTAPNGQDYYDALYQALYDSESHEWDDGYVWLYQPTDGLMSEQSYATSRTVGPDGGTENVIGGVLRLTSPFNEGNTSNLIRYLLTPNTVTAGRLAVKAKIIDTFVSSDASGIPGGLNLRLSNGVNGGHYYIGKKEDKIALKIYNGSTGSDNVVVETQIPINEPHIFELELNNSGFKVKIDHVDIYTSNTFAGWYVTSNAIGCMGGPNTPNGATADIEWCAYYEG